MAKRRSRQRELPLVVCFVDECLGSGDVPRALMSCEGVDVQLHRDHFDQGTRDVDWLPVVAGRGWVVLTKDVQITRRPIEVEAWKRAQAVVVALQSQSLNGSQQGAALAKAMPRIRGWLVRYRRPLIITVSRSGTPTVKFGERVGARGRR